MKTKTKIFIAIGVVAIIFLVIWLVRGSKKEQSLITTVPVEKGDVATIVTSTGTIQPVDTVAVGTQVSGIIQSIYTDFNATVKEGQLLAELDPTLMQASVNQIKANLAQATSTLNYQTANYKRQKELFDVGAISKANYDLALNSYETAVANVNSIKAQLSSAQQNLAFTKIYSPINGVVLNRNVSVGQTVAASFNTPTLFSLAKDITKMQVQAMVDEADIGEIAAGERVTFTVDAYVDQLFEGTVSEVRLQPTTSSNVVTYTTIVNTSNDDMKLKPGMTATVTIFTKEAKNILVVPNTAFKFVPDATQVTPPYTLQSAQSMKPGQGEAFLWVLQGRQIAPRIVKIGMSNNTSTEIKSGLNENEQVITALEKSKEAATAQGEGASPFMPTPPRRR
ncbi:efflux RND transporter periplasmic adaptor subunit [Olivibacter sitiensis]|uniref:efflux RND transporter periplasmic adaptor subunit n=1 Tax=Olivibacter sitiensis TaxID=376470 RepID=UPI0003F7FF5D|nr:efflux RND transporter periplasmic adaptor subunit [Olivibacter sitiensis]